MYKPCTVSCLLASLLRFTKIFECWSVNGWIEHCPTWLISRKSWETSTRPPSKWLMASARASIVSMSKWLVGSSSNSMWGCCHASHANTTRHLNWFHHEQYFLLVLMGIKCYSPLSVRQLFDGCRLCFSRDPVASNDFSHGVTVLKFWELFQHVVQRREVHLQQLMQVLFFES